ncbi:MAG: hypothetical protein JXB26_18985 [Candidatus Aminicenantes bacterium]|nr:hypothetical protein [Candidatus Aminicenantes bacterium]
MKIRGFLVILILAAAVVLVLRYMKSGKEELPVEVETFKNSFIAATRADLSTMAKEINTFMAMAGRTPNSLKEVRTSRFPIAGKKDSWGTLIKYQKLSVDMFRLISAGPDKIFDTQDDIVFNN